MELQLMAASLRSRENYDLIRSYIDVKLRTYSAAFQVIMAKIGDYYARDGTTTSVAPQVLIEQMRETIRNDKHVDRFSDMIAEALGETSSDANVRAVVLMAKQQEVGDALALALGRGEQGEKVDALIEELSNLRQMTSLEELTEQGLEVYDDIDLEQLIAVEFDPDSLIKVYPLSLNDRLGGGAKRGHNLTLFARPEVGKSATCVSINSGFARQGLKSLYFINEDRPQDIILRHVANLSGLNKQQIAADPKRAMSLANDAGFKNLLVVSASPGTPKQIQEYIDKYEPDAVVIDQLRNLKVRSDNRVNQLELAATEIRNIAKRMNVLTIGVTQAGDSADGKAVLEMGDVDFSNTGIPAQADVMIGIGMNAELEAEERRVISLPKNKLSGDHSSFPVNINRMLSRITSV